MTERVLRQIAEIQRLGLPDLKDRWRELFGTEPPPHSKGRFVKRLVFRVQELAYGGISDETRARLRELVSEDGLDSPDAIAARVERRRRQNGTPVSGTRLIREWQGRRYEVTVADGGFEFEGRPYRSLSAIARAITGTQWNGPAFFGLRKPERKRSS